MHFRNYWSPEELIAAVVRLRARHGFVSAKLIDADPALPSAATFARRFGSLRQCYQLAGFPMSHSEILVEAQVRRERARGRRVAQHF